MFFFRYRLNYCYFAAVCFSGAAWYTVNNMFTLANLILFFLSCVYSVNIIIFVLNFAVLFRFFVPAQGFVLLFSLFYIGVML